MDRRHAGLLVLVVAMLVVSIAFVLPFLDYFLLSVLLAYVLHPLHRRLSRTVSATISASVIVVAAAVIVVVPMLVAIRTSYAEAVRIVEQLREGDLSFGRVEESIFELTGMEVDLTAALQDLVRDAGLTAFGDVVSLVGTLTHVLIGVGLTLFLLFYFLKDGEHFLSWLRDVAPLEPDVVEELFAEIDGITSAVLAGHVLVALVQGFLAGVGIWVAGVPNATFWTAIMIVLALLPIIGSFMVWGPAVAWLFVTGQVVEAGALLVYGTVVVGVSDDYLRPIVVDRYAKVSPAVIIIGVLGGVYVIGFMGIFVGPIVLGSLRATIEIYDRETAEGS